MTDDSKLSDETASQAVETVAAASSRSCLLCTRSFVPQKRSQRYCNPRHRRRALKVRQLLDRLLGEMGGTPGRVSAPGIARHVKQARKRKGLPPLLPDAFLRARAQCVLAEQQIKRWTALLVEHRKALQALEEPALQTTLAVLRPGDSVPVDVRATHGEIVDGDGALAVFAFGHRAPPR